MMNKDKIHNIRISVVLGIITASLLMLSLYYILIKPPFKGTGKIDTPFQIENTEDFVKLTKLLSSGERFEGKYFVMTNDIDMGAVDYKIEGRFSGVFDGDGHLINNLFLVSEKAAGLFNEVDGTVINLTVNSGMISGKEASGAIAAHVMENGKILNCCNFASVECESGITGGIAGICDGRIINCATIVTDDEPGGQHITGDDEKVMPENCYTWNGELFELICNGYEGNKTNVINKSLEGLNDRIAELVVENGGLSFNTWSLTEEYPFLKLTSEKADGIVAVSVVGSNNNIAELKYDFDRHSWILGGDNSGESDALDFYGKEITYTTINGNDNTIVCNSKLQEISISVNGMDSLLSVSSPNLAKNCDDGFEIYRVENDGSTMDENTLVADDSITEIKRGYFDLSGQEYEDETIVILNKAGNYVLSGELKGRIETADAESNDIRDKLRLSLNNINITSKYDTGIYVRSGYEFEIELVDGSENSIDASSVYNIYSSGVKHEGAISTDVPVTFYGDSGVLQIAGDIEGVEALGDITFEGGSYFIKTDDDSLAAKGRLTINDGFFDLRGYDNCIDCDEVYIEGGILTGSNMYSGETFMKTDVRYNGGVVAIGFGKNRELADDSQYNLLTKNNKNGFNEGDIYVLIDEKGNQVIAYKCISDTPGVAFGIESINNSGFSIKKAEKIDGEWKGNVCFLNL